MYKNKQIYFTTGEFAKIVNVTKSTLFHYDKLKIFSPEIKDENEYRYYSAFQVEAFFVVSTLKELGMPLKEIKLYLDKRDPKKLVSLLSIQNKKIDKEIERLIKLKKLISQKIDITQSLDAIDTNEVFISKEKTKLLFITSALAFKDAKSVSVSFANHIKDYNEKNINTTFSVGQMISSKEIFKKNYSAYTFFYTVVESPKDYDNMYSKKQGNYLTAYHTHGYNSIDETYLKITSYAKENNIKLDKYFYEDVILDELSVNGYENFVIKISILII